MRKLIFTAAVFCAFYGSAALALPNENVLSDVPEYKWFRGCTPTTGGMLMGYWGLKYPGLFNYLPPMTNNPDVPDDPANRIISGLAFSLGSTATGNTSIAIVPSGLRYYAREHGFSVKSKHMTPSFDLLKSEIDAGRPMHFAITISQSVLPIGHSVLAYGYKTDENGDQWYAVRDTWVDGDSNGFYNIISETDENGVEWFKFVTEPYTRYKITKMTYFRPPDPLKNRKQWQRMQALFAENYAAWESISKAGTERPDFLDYRGENISFVEGVDESSLPLKRFVPVAPEPSGISFIAIGIGGLFLRRRRA